MRAEFDRQGRCPRGTGRRDLGGQAEMTKDLFDHHGLLDESHQPQTPPAARARQHVRYAIPQNWMGRYPWVAGNPSDPSVFTALREQFGLTLDPANEAVDALIIDYIERPSPN